jgi:hypothetical protein
MKNVEAMIHPALRPMIPALLQTEEFSRMKQELIAGGITALQSASPLIKDGVLNELAVRLGILSLTEDPANILMWAHYAANHSGFVLEFNDEHEWFHQRKSSSDDLRNLRQVSYVCSTEPRFLTELEGADVLYAKSEDWHYEREWRIVRPLTEASVVSGDIHLFEFPPEVLTGIIFGLRSGLSLKSSAKAIIAEQTDLRHMRVGEVTRGSEGNTLGVSWL